MKRLACLAGAPLLALAACTGSTERAVAPAMTATPAATTNLIVVSSPEPAAPPAAPGPEDALAAPVQYACEGGAAFSAVFPAHGRTATVTAAVLHRTLDLVQGADTPFYRRDGVQLAADGAGAGADLTGAGLDYSGCTAD